MEFADINLALGDVEFSLDDLNMWIILILLFVFKEIFEVFLTFLEFVISDKILHMFEVIGLLHGAFFAEDLIKFDHFFPVAFCDFLFNALVIFGKHFHLFENFIIFKFFIFISLGCKLFFCIFQFT